MAANGGYRSPGHALSRHASRHCWGTAANIYRVGDAYLDNREEIERCAAIARRAIPGELMHRQGTSYHLPTGGAVYFDTGVIEVATPVVEIEPGCAARAGRSLWEALQFIRGELDAWDAKNGHQTRLVGVSAHYNVSFELPRGEPANGRTIAQLARLLTYILAAPVMLHPPASAPLRTLGRPRREGGAPRAF